MAQTPAKRATLTREQLGIVDAAKDIFETADVSEASGDTQQLRRELESARRQQRDERPAQPAPIDRARLHDAWTCAKLHVAFRECVEHFMPAKAQRRPAVIAQDDRFDATAPVKICAFTSDPTGAPLVPSRLWGADRDGRRPADGRRHSISTCFSSLSFVAAS